MELAGAGLRFRSRKSLVCVEATMRTIKKLEHAETRAPKKFKLSKSSSAVQTDKDPDQGNRYSFFILLTDLVLAQAFSFRLRHHGEEAVGRSLYVESGSQLKTQFM